MNPPAFPVITDYLSKGMTLRDYFAARAMQGMLSGASSDLNAEFYQRVVTKAYSLADAMLKEREK